ncbi:MAG: beta-lactamase family protein [Erysipelotrichaceae bacterium]|nr:beta-lactamase family protein [Erysipelotrichaceae bacterium]
MLNNIIQNINYITKEDIHELETLFEISNIEEYVYSSYHKLMEQWNQEYPMFDIPSGMIGIRMNDTEYYYSIGAKEYTEDTIFDIASMTKLYTEFVLFAFLEEYHLSLDTKLKELTTVYPNIEEMTILDLLEFKNTYRTTVDIRNCTNKKDAVDALRTVYTLEEKAGYYLYTDLPIMILTDVMEMYSGRSYQELFQQYIIEKYQLMDTYLAIDSDRYVTVNKGMINDPKANIMGGYYGHAGVKTTSKDFITFLYHVMNSQYVDLFVTPSRVIDDVTDLPIVMKGIIGNSNISNVELEGMASKYLPALGFAVQGSVRCHGETMKFVIDEKEYTVSSCIFLDLYTQVENIRKYEQETGKILTKEYDVDGYGPLIMCDVRSLLSYQGVYKELTNVVGKARVMELSRYLEIKRV